VDGDRRLKILHVDQLREFVGLPAEATSSSYRDFAAALRRVLEGVERAVLQMPADRFLAPTPNRGRDLAQLVYNIHVPIASLGDALETGRFVWDASDDYGRSRHLTTPAALAEFCRGIRTRWWERASAVGPDAAYDQVETERGPLSNLQLLEWQGFHAAQHLRQIYVFLREIGVEPAGEVTGAEMAPIELGEAVF
jgi:hypothetical protein